MQERYDPLTQLGAVLLPSGTDTDHLKVWLYDRSIEVVVHKWLGHCILRVSVHAHTSESDIRALVEATRTYFSEGHYKL